MGKGKTPVYQAPKPPKLPTADELYGSATKYAKANQPLAFGAREGALQDLSLGDEYYKQFQPTSFEEALTNQYYDNVWPDMEGSIKHGLSLAGLDSSPILARELGRAKGNLGYDIGSQLLNLANTRATNSLNARLGIDPNSMISPYVNTGMNQGNAQASLDYDYAKQLAQTNYMNQLNDYNNNRGLVSTMSRLGGTALGAIAAPFTGGLSLGAGMALGGMGGSLVSPFLGGNAPTSESMSGDMLGFMMGGGGDWMSGLGKGVSSVNPQTVGAFGGGTAPYSMPTDNFGRSLYEYAPFFGMN